MQKNCNFQTHLKYNFLLKLFKILSITVTSLLLIVISFLHYQQFPIYEWKFILEYIKDNRQKEDFNSIATKLGYNENDKLLIIHADDVGLSKSVNESTFESFKNNSITSAAIIMNTYEMEEGLKFAVENPNFDFGVHLTVTSEWKYHKWGGILDKAKTPSLHNSVNNFYWNKRKFVKNADLNEIKMELQAQISLAKSMGLKPSHLSLIHI